MKVIKVISTLITLVIYALPPTKFAPANLNQGFTAFTTC